MVMATQMKHEAALVAELQTAVAESNSDSQVVEAEPVKKSTFHLSHLSSSLVMFVFPTVSFPVSSLPTIQANVDLST